MPLPIPRTIFEPEHEQFRDSLRRFLQREVVPNYARYEEQGLIDRDVWEKAGAAGFLCSTMPERLGGFDADRRFSAVFFEEIARMNVVNLLGMALHSDIVAPYLLHYGSAAAQAKYLPPMAAGRMIGAIAMTEPNAGSDLQGLRTTAVRDGEHYVVNGAKTFITNGIHCDLAIVVAKTDSAKGANGTSLLVVDTSMPGFKKGTHLKKIGLKAQDTSELYFDDVRVPAENLLGQENKGFVCLMQELPWERLQVAITSVASAATALDQTIDYCRERKAFGKTVLEFQNTRYTLAALETDVQMAQVFVDRCLELELNKTLDPAMASMAKLAATEMQGKVLDACLQLHGGHGYMWDMPIARAWADARVTRIYAGTSEIMKELIARSL